MSNTLAAIQRSIDRTRLRFDAQNLHTSAVEIKDGYLLNGEKTYVPYADAAEAMIIYARLGNETEGFIVRSGTEGLAIGERQKTLGIHALLLYSLS